MQVQDGATEINPQGPDHHLVEAVGGRDVVGGLLGPRQQEAPAVGPGPHEVIEAPERRLAPRPHHEPVARGEAGAGDVTYEGVAVLSRARLRFLDATPRMAIAKATDTRASTVWMALKPVDLVSSPRMFLIRVTQMKIVQAAAVRRIKASVLLTGSP
jgi:hypothetical protein